MINTYMGLKIVVDDISMSKTVEDWSNVRSYSRAKRRRKRGFPQKITYKIVPKEEFLRFGDTIVMHSEMLRKLEMNNYEWSSRQSYNTSSYLSF